MLSTVGTKLVKRERQTRSGKFLLFIFPRFAAQPTVSTLFFENHSPIFWNTDHRNVLLLFLFQG